MAFHFLHDSRSADVSLKIHRWGLVLNHEKQQKDKLLNGSIQFVQCNQCVWKPRSLKLIKKDVIPSLVMLGARAPTSDELHANT